MKRYSLWLNYAADLHIELMQSKEQGRDAAAFTQRVKAIQAMDPQDPQREVLAKAVYDELAALGEGDNGYTEPSDLEGILQERPADWQKYVTPGVDKKDLYDRVYGAWLGRCAGCLLGKPVEGWYRGRIAALLKAKGEYPLRNYISSEVPAGSSEEFPTVLPGDAWIDQVAYMPEDDDTNYTLLSLRIAENFGVDFTTADVAFAWLKELPITHLCTAERVTYKNLVNLVPPEQAGNVYNPYREWIGAQIRTDFYGYVTPGDPEKGARMGYRDGALSHIRNGIYGAMFVPAMLSHAAVSTDIEEVINAGLSQLPENSRFTQYMREAISYYKSGISAEDAINRVHSKFDETLQHHWCHVIPNAMIVVIALLYGRLDFERSICMAVEAGFDTDCNGATVGSVLGMMLGADALPEKWVAPLNDRLLSGVSGFQDVRISDMAKRTLEFVK